jgi:polyhydroxyalkanoate synthesis regulator phasin
MTDKERITAEEYLKDRFGEVIILKVNPTKEQVDYFIKKALSIAKEEGRKERVEHTKEVYTEGGNGMIDVILMEVDYKIGKEEEYIQKAIKNNNKPKDLSVHKKCFEYAKGTLQELRKQIISLKKEIKRHN